MPHYPGQRQSKKSCRFLGGYLTFLAKLLECSAEQDLRAQPLAVQRRQRVSGGDLQRREGWHQLELNSNPSSTLLVHS